MVAVAMVAVAMVAVVVVSPWPVPVTIFKTVVTPCAVLLVVAFLSPSTLFCLMSWAVDAHAVDSTAAPARMAARYSLDGPPRDGPGLLGAADLSSMFASQKGQQDVSTRTCQPQLWQGASDMVSG